jgi:hypothetical protein
MFAPPLPNQPNPNILAEFYDVERVRNSSDGRSGFTPQIYLSGPLPLFPQNLLNR